MELEQALRKLPFFGAGLKEEIRNASVFQNFPAGTELVRDGQFVKFVPIVIEGLVKVYTHTDDKELLLYYIQPDQSCIMSFSSCINNHSSRIFAITEEQSIILLLPSDHLLRWVKEYPEINLLFYQQYDMRYSELIHNIQDLLYHKLDRRLLDYLEEKVRVSGKNPVKIAHREIANDLGTAREVISRLVKKFEKQMVLKQHHDSIELLSGDFGHHGKTIT
jgi:CRP/FNR family transcriptional regulator